MKNHFSINIITCIGTKCYVETINIQRSQDHLAIPEDRKYSLAMSTILITSSRSYYCKVYNTFRRYVVYFNYCRLSQIHVVFYYSTFPPSCCDQINTILSYTFVLLLLSRTYSVLVGLNGLIFLMKPPKCIE